MLLGDRIDFDYQVGCLQLEADLALCFILAVTEVDGAVLVAVPEAVWDRTKAKRLLPVDALRKAVRVMVPACIEEDRTTPEPQPSFKIWFGGLKESFEVSVHYGTEEVKVTCGFPVDELGVPKYHFAKALVAIAKDHFEFATAEEQGLIPVHGGRGIEQRMRAVEDLLKQMQTGLVRLRPSAPPGPAADRMTFRKSRGGGEIDKNLSPELPPGLDPGIARQALQSGSCSAPFGFRGGRRGTGGRGSPRRANLVEKAVLQLSKIVQHLSQDKKVKADKSLEALLDRAESGSGWSSETKDSLGGQSQQVSSTPVTEANAFATSRADLQSFGAADVGGFNSSRSSSMCHVLHSDCSWLVGAMFKDPELSGLSALLGA